MQHRTDLSRRFRLWCKENTCLYCVMKKAEALARATATAEPTHLVTLTSLPDDWDEIEPRVDKLRRILGRACFEWTYTVEHNHLDGNHLHAWVRGPDVPQHDEWQHAAERVAFGYIVNVTPARPSRSLWYGLKTITQLDTLCRDEATDMLTSYLDLNGGRLAHSSRNYWRDETGARIAGMNEAIKQVQGRRGLEDPAEWCETHEDHLPQVLADLAARQGNPRPTTSSQPSHQ